MKGLAITEERNRDWVGIGDNNDYYQCLIDAYMESTTNQATINGIVNMIYGKGLDATIVMKNLKNMHK